MAGNISDVIEEFIKSVIGTESTIQVSRNELANYFSVAPSQINYVLATRFNTDKGYIVESRRGGGGCITIVRLSLNPDDVIPKIIKELDSINDLTFNRACNILERLVRDEIIDQNEANIIKSAVSDKALAIPIMAGGLRKNVFKEILIGIMRR